MKKAYVLTETTQAKHLCEFTLGVVGFVFTSKKKAHLQMDKIADLVTNGGWWSNVDGKPMLGKVIRDVSGDYLGNILREMLIETPNGLHEIWRMTEVELNLSYGFDE